MFESEGLSTAQAVEQLKAKRSAASQPEQTVENTEPVDVSVDETEPVEEVTEETESTEEFDESDKEPIEDSDDDSDLFYDLDGEEVSTSQLREWKSGNLRQSDYTRKTQAHAEEVKQFKQQQEEFSGTSQKLESKIAELESLLSEDIPSAEDIQEWREYEPEKYIDYTEKKTKREKLLADAKGLVPEKTNNFQEEYTSFAKSIDGVDDNGQATESFKADVALMTKYAESNGLTHDDISGFKSGHFRLLLDAAKFNDGKTKNAAIAKKVRKAPVSTKPKAGAKSSMQSEIQVAEARFKKTGSPNDAAKLRQLKRQLN
jgi:hypothetical protein